MLANHNIYDIFVTPMLARSKALDGILAKLEAHIETTKGNEAFYLNDRLYPDMFPFIRQVQISTDNIKGATARLAGIENPKFEDTETTVAQLRARVQKLIEFLGTVSAKDFEGAETKDIVLKFPNGYELKFIGWDYLNQFALPNTYFHLTTAYDILRHRGVVLGKTDFLGGE